MAVSVIDTLRYADRLKTAGVETRQAEAMSRALNDELAVGVATKQDLDRAVDTLKGGIAKVETQGRYVFLVLGLIAALGLYNAISPHMATVAPQTDVETAQTARG